MRARAPGKVVLSGAYAVLEGARAVVAAVDRYVVADASKPGTFLTPEVAAALAGEGVTSAEAAPWFDAEALRHEGRKLGLGSSAAILCASLAARVLAREPALSAADLAERVFRPALAAHRAAQRGGSGIDVAASAYGGVLVARRAADGLELSRVAFPPGIRITVLASPLPASTPQLIRSVRALATSAPRVYAGLLARQSEASEQAADAFLSGDAASLLAALARQGDALRELGVAARVPIVTPEVLELQAAAQTLGAAALPAGAGGGDVALWVTTGAAPPSIAGLETLSLVLGAAGTSLAEG